MAKITAEMVKTLRERTGAGMMDCKKALQAAEGDMEAAIEQLRSHGLAKAAKKESRVAAEGEILIHSDAEAKKALMIEINSETDFVAREDNFKTFAKQVAKVAFEAGVIDPEQIEQLPYESGESKTTIQEVRKDLIAKLGENIQINRAVLMQAAASGCVSGYVHGGRIGCLVKLSTDDTQLAKDIAMHVVANHPEAIAPDDITQERIEKEKSIYRAQAESSGKPDHIIEKMISGRVNKFLNEVSLIGQPFVKDPEITVGDLLKQHQAEVQDFTRFALGEGKAKKESDFAQEVKAQVESSKDDE